MEGSSSTAITASASGKAGAFHLAALRQSQIVSRRVMIRLLHSGLIHGSGVCQIGVGRRLFAPCG